MKRREGGGCRYFFFLLRTPIFFIKSKHIVINALCMITILIFNRTFHTYRGLISNFHIHSGIFFSNHTGHFNPSSYPAGSFVCFERGKRYREANGQVPPFLGDPPPKARMPPHSYFALFHFFFLSFKVWCAFPWERALFLILFSYALWLYVHKGLYVSVRERSLKQGRFCNYPVISRCVKIGVHFKKRSG